MDYCDPDSFIANFATTPGTTDLETKNVDCVSLESDTVTCTHLTINGQDIVPLLVQAVEDTQFQSTTAIPAATIFAGKVVVNEAVYVPNVDTDTITVRTVGGDITIGSSLFTGTVEFENTVFIRTTTTTTTSSTLMVLQPNAGLNTQQTIVVGKAQTTNNYAQLKFNYITSGSAVTNYGELSVSNNNGLQVYSNYINIPSGQEIRVAGNTMWPKRNVNTTTGVSLTSAATVNLSMSTSYAFTSTDCPKHVVFSFYNLDINNNVKTPIIRLCTSNILDYATTPAVFQGITVGSNGSNILEWGDNATNYIGAGIPLWQRNWPGAGYSCSGKVEMVLMQMTTTGTTITSTIWAISGNVHAYSSSSGNRFMNTLSGTMYMNAPSTATFKFLSLQSQTTPSTGIGNLMHS